MRIRRDKGEWLADWEAITAAQISHWSVLDGDERARLGELIEWFVRRKHFEAAANFALTPEMVVSISARACLLILGLDRDAYQDVSSVVVFPRPMRLTGVRSTSTGGVVDAGATPVLGHTSTRRGPVVVSWDTARRDARHPQSGHDVVFHEFAHKIDARDGRMDGTPLIHTPAERSEWIKVNTAEYRRLRRSTQPSVLRRYATTNPSEFFAVATEVFFDVPLVLQAERPRLYEILRTFYRQDPGLRVARDPRIVAP